jgi:predicted lipoprotein with Yx(FWY)xxD motif
MSDLEPLCPRDARRARRRLVARVAACASLVALAFAAFANPAAAVAPYVAGVSATPVTGGFNLKGTIYPYNLDTTYHFELGTTTSYGTNVPTPDADAGAGSIAYVSQTVTGLQPNTTYHFRLVASNSSGPATGDTGDHVFTTPADPSVPPPPPNTDPGTDPNKPGPNQTRTAKTIRVKEAKNHGKTILTTSSGRTLYSLSAEKNGKFICTKSSGCLALWHPLMVPKGATLKGPVKLGTIKRPEGGRQVTYHGRPLYSFIEDTKPGSIKGEGIKDVGTWHAATVPKHKH